jgi:glycosyltransferase involved in cell wall biosynthesis
MKSPTVSIIIPTYNAECYIQAALKSLLVDQEVSVEIIVVDDGSTDCSVQRVKMLNDSRIRLVSNRGKGISDAINTGLEYAEGLFVSRCDADDLYPSRRLAWQVAWLEENPDFIAVCGNYRTLDPQGNTVVEFDCGTIETEITAELRKGITRTHLCTFLIRIDFLRKIGGCRTYFKTAEDIDVQLRLGEQGRIWYVPKVSYYYRLHNLSITHAQGSSERDFYNKLARTFQLQRLSTGKDDLDRGMLPSIPLSSIEDDRPKSSSDHIFNLLVYRAWREHQNGQRLVAITTGLRALRCAPFTIAAWRNFLLLIIKFPKQENIR